MANKKSKSKKKSGGKRKVGTAQSDALMKTVLILTGGFVGAMSKVIIDGISAKQEKPIKQSYLDWGSVVVGAPIVFFGGEIPFLQGVGLGLTLKGGGDGLQAAGLLSGIMGAPMAKFIPAPNPNFTGLPAPNTVAGLSSIPYQVGRSKGARAVASFAR